ncbi:MAG TPA: MerR family transcriptional regulator [Rhizomicrobium sp.]|jgi:MerR family mercuric resistance operon transcriptional regulator
MARRIGDVARAAGVGVETVRFYERKGLVEQPLKPARGWRDYGEDALRQVEYVRLARELGLTLRDIGRLKTLSRGQRPQFCEGVRDTLAQRLARIAEEIDRLERKRAALGRWLSQCKRRGNSPECPLYAQLQSVAPQASPKTPKIGR